MNLSSGREWQAALDRNPLSSVMMHLKKKAA
jgi:hypothetical protein